MSQGLSLPIGKRHSAAASAAPPSGGILPRFWVGTFFEQLDWGVEERLVKSAISGVNKAVFYACCVRNEALPLKEL